MPTLIAPTVLGTSAAGVNVSTIGVTVKIPANILCIADVIQRHTTPASLGTVTVASPTVGAWNPEATTTYGGASPTVRITRFSALLSADAAGEVVTATASASQTGLAVRVTAHGGNNATSRAAAIRQTAAANSAGGNVTTLAPGPTLAAFGDVKNGAYSIFAASSGGVTPKPGWTELVETTMVASVQGESQYILSNDTVANATQISALLAGITSEIVAVPNPLFATQSSFFSLTGVGYATGPNTFTPVQTQTFRAGRTLFLVFEGSGSSAVITSVSFALPSGVNQSTLYSSISGASVRIVLQLSTTSTVDVAATIDIGVTTTSSGNFNCAGQVIELPGVDMTKGTAGVIQSVNTTWSATGATVTATPGTFASVNNAALLFAMGAGANVAPINTVDTGWIAVGAATINSTQSVQAWFRPNAPAGVSAVSAVVLGAMLVIELAAAPLNSPTVTLVSPTNGSTIAQGATITIDALDVDGDLTTVSITANGEAVTATGTTLPAPYSGGSISTVTGPPAGKRFAFPRTAGFTVGPLGVSGVATDSQGHTTPFSYSFTIAAPVTHFPVISLLSPPPGTMLPSDAIAVSTTDADGDLTSITGIFGPVSELGYSGAAFGANFNPASTQAPLTGPDGSLLTFRRTGGFAVGALSLTVQAIDALGHTTTQVYSWTVISPVVVPGTSILPAVGGDDGIDIWYDVATPAGADRIVTAGGDWRMTAGEEALAQSLLRRLITSPNEWVTLPGYGCGALEYVDAENTQANRDELANRIRAQFIRDDRVTKVTAVIVDLSDPNVLHMRIEYLSKLRAQSSAPSVLSVGIPGRLAT